MPFDSDIDDMMYNTKHSDTGLYGFFHYLYSIFTQIDLYSKSSSCASSSLEKP